MKQHRSSATCFSKVSSVTSGVQKSLCPPRQDPAMLAVTSGDALRRLEVLTSKQ